MRVNRTYAKGGMLGGFFGNSQDKFSHMAGAEGGFDRKEFRDLRRRKRQGESLTGADAQRLNYMKNVRGDRTKKAIMGGALAAGAAIAGGPALSAALKKAGTKMASKAASKSATSGLVNALNAAPGAASQAGAGASGLAGKAGSLLGGPGAQKALALGKNIAKGSQLLSSLPKTQSQGMQGLSAPQNSLPQQGLMQPGQNVGQGLMSSLGPSLFQNNLPSQGLMAPGGNVGQGVLNIQDFYPPEENFDYEGESVDQGIQNFDPLEENFDDGSGFDLQGALQAFSQYAGENGMRIPKKGSKITQVLNYGGKIRVLKAEEGVKVPEGADVRSLLASLDRFSEEKKRRKKMEDGQFAPPTPDKEMNDKVLSFLLEKFKDSAPSIMGAKATDRYYNR